MTVRVGDSVPDIAVDFWERAAHEAGRLSLADYRGKWLILFFYPRDFTYICPTELAALAELQDEFEAEGAALVAASTDSFFSHDAWFGQEANLQNVDFPVIADTSHELSRTFNILLDDGAALRATFIVDPEGIIRHMTVNELDVGRNVDETLRVLRGLKFGDLCPEGWQPGVDNAHTYNDYLARVFPRLTEAVLAGATKELRTVAYCSGDIIIRQGDRSDRFYIIAEGEVAVVHMMEDGKEAEIATMGPGEMFGEMGILLEVRRTADVRANTDVSLLALGWDDFSQLVASSEKTAQDFMRIVEQRQARTSGIS